MQLKTDVCCQFLQLICSDTENRKHNSENRIQNTEYRRSYSSYNSFALVLKQKRKPLLPVLTLNQFWLSTKSDSQPDLTPQTPGSLCSDHCMCQRETEWERSLKEMSRPSTLRNSEQQCNAMSILHICHFFYTTTIWGLKILHLKVRNCATKVVSR